MRRLLLLACCLSFVVSCEPRIDSFETNTSARGLATPPELVSPSTLQRYKDALPTVAYRRLQQIFESPNTIWYDKTAMIPSYQDSVGDGSFTPIGARPNSRGRGIIVPAGRRLFHPDNEHWSFPFGHTAGTDRVENKLVVNFMHLPEDASGEYLPVVYWTIDDNRALGGLGLHKWTWLFPVGTTLGEVIFLDDGGDLYPIEVRTRRRYLTGWAVNAYRPFATAQRLADAVKRERPDWANDGTLSTFVAHLEDDTAITPKSLDSPDFNQIFQVSGFEDVLPPIGDAALVRTLLSSTTFVSAYGLPWKKDGQREAFYATTNEAFSIVSADNDVGVLEVREEFCVNCHQEAGRGIHEFEPDAILYGDIWGEDRIFSFHPWDQTQYPEFNTDNRRVRPAFAQSGVVVRYDERLHPDTIYRAIQ